MSEDRGEEKLNYSVSQCNSKESQRYEINRGPLELAIAFEEEP